MRWSIVWLVGGCAVGTLPGSDPVGDSLEGPESVDGPETVEDTDVEEPDWTDGCRGCDSSTEPSVTDLVVDLEFVAPGTTGLLSGTFYASVYDADVPDASVRLAFSVPIEVEEGVPTGVLHTIEVTASTHFIVTGFLDLDGNADPADPQWSEGDAFTNGTYDDYYASGGVALARVVLNVF